MPVVNKVRAYALCAAYAFSGDNSTRREHTRRREPDTASLWNLPHRHAVAITDRGKNEKKHKKVIIGNVSSSLHTFLLLL